MYLIRLTLENFFDEILGDIDVAARKIFDESGDIAGALQRMRRLHCQRSQLQAGDPAFGARFQCSHIISRQIQTYQLIKKGGSLVAGEAQIERAQFAELIAGAQAGQRPRRPYLWKSKA